MDNNTMTGLKRLKRDGNCGKAIELRLTMKIFILGQGSEVFLFLKDSSSLVLNKRAKS